MSNKFKVYENDNDKQKGTTANGVLNNAPAPEGSDVRLDLQPRGFGSEEEAYAKSCVSTEKILYPAKGDTATTAKSDDMCVPPTRSYDDLTNIGEVMACYRSRSYESGEVIPKTHAMPFDFCGSMTMYMTAIIAILVLQVFLGVLIIANPAIESWGTVILEATLLLTVLIFAASQKYRRNFTFVRNRKTSKGITPATVIIPILLSAVVYMGFFLFVTFYTELLTHLGIPESAGTITTSSVADIVAIVIGAVVLAPIAEEIIFRGVIFHAMKEKFSIVFAILMSALLFMLFHMNILQTVYQFVLGASIAYVVYRSGRLITGMIFHFASNGIALLTIIPSVNDFFVGYATWGMNNLAISIPLCILLMAAALVIVFFVGKYAFPAENKKSPEVAAVFNPLKAPRIIHRQDGLALNVAKTRTKQGKLFMYLIITICSVVLILSWILLACASMIG